MPSVVPEAPLAPYAPSDGRPWTLARVAHLYRRAAFGATWGTLQAGLKRSPREIVDELLDYDASDDPFNDTLESLIGFVDVKEPRALQNWWLHRALNTPRPVQERMALFWHDHFATSAAKVSQGEHMHQQIELFRAMGVGSFREMLVAVGRDPAMLIWLDGRESKKGKPNENYAREVMELFTLGVGHYSEADVKQLASCFTGWSIKDGKGAFNPKDFDDGEKSVLNRTGKFNDEQAVDVLLSQPAASRYLARKLLAEFVHPSPDDKLIDELAALIVRERWEMRPVLRVIWSSNVFFSDYAYRSRIKSPMELCAGLAIAMGGRIKTDFVREQMGKMGQSLLYPPNVKGWDGHEAWINANTLIVRMNYGWHLAQHRGQDYAKRGSVEAMLKQSQADAPDEIVAFFADALLDGQLRDDARQAFVDYLNQDDDAKPRPFSNKDHGGGSRGVRSMIRAMTALPEFQLA
jgi:uncharacterized protein (DUF1800 family)